MGSVRADITGDGTDEVGAFALEVAGAARGPWYQIHDSDGSIVADHFLRPNFSQFQFLTANVDGSVGDELVILSTRDSDGAAHLEVRAPDGSVMASVFVTGSAFGNHQLFPIDFDGGTESEIGLGFVRNSDGVGFYQIWALTGLSLTQQHSRAITGAPFGSHRWDAGDFDNDGNEEVFVGFRRNADGAAAYRVWDPQTDSGVGSSFITGSPFSGHQWVVGNFDNSQPGAEILVGFSRISDGAAAFQVVTVSGAVIGSRFVTGSAFSDHMWDGISDGIDEQVFVGFVRNSDGAGVFQVWDPTGSLTAPEASPFVTGSAVRVEDWLTGNFDGDASNGEEVAVGFTKTSDGAIGFQQWSRAGTQNGSRFVLGGAFGSPHFLGLSPVTMTREDLLVGATGSDGQPIIQLWNTNGAGIQLLSKFIFNGDVI